MKVNIEIRDYRVGDFEAIAPLWQMLDLGSAHRGDNAAVIEQTLKLGGRLLLMFDDNSNTLIGTSWITVDGRRSYMHHFGIHSAYQGKGLGKLLLDHSLQVAKSIGLQIKLEVHKKNKPALRLYEHAGFQYLGDYLIYIIRDISQI